MLYDTEDSAGFGYDSSQGYTSLNHPGPGEKRRGFFARWKLKKQRLLAEKSERRDERDRERLDALLEKIHLEGMGSLSSSERRFLESASKKLRKAP